MANSKYSVESNPPHPGSPWHTEDAQYRALPGRNEWMESSTLNNAFELLYWFSEREILATVLSTWFVKIEDIFPLPLRLIYFCTHNFFLSDVEDCIYYPGATAGCLPLWCGDQT